MNKEDWGRAGSGLVSDRWNMLEAYGIPCLRSFPGDGGFGRVIMGASGTGVDIFVPKSMLEEATMLIEGENCDEEL